MPSGQATPTHPSPSGDSDRVLTGRTYVHLMDAGVGDAEFFDEAVAAARLGK